MNTPDSVINGLNECENLFHRVTSAKSSLESKQNMTQQDKLQEEILQLQSGLHQFLSGTLQVMYNLIDRAEWRIHDNCVADLLSKLKDAMYDAEDLLDEFRWYETMVSIEGNAISVEANIDFFHNVTQGNFNKVTVIRERLNDLSEQLKEMGLLNPRFDKSAWPETSSFRTEENSFDRYEEKMKLIRSLGVSVPTNNSRGPSQAKKKRIEVSSSGSNQVCATIDNYEATTTSVPEVLPIVGIGGVGKTTLAQKIWKNLYVRRHFDLKIWIHVSKHFDVKRLMKEAIVQSSGKVPENGNLDSLHTTLANSLNTKRFLIVLDDMWDENKEHWNRFCEPFRNGLQGSMMLVTTRSSKVAEVVRTTSMDPFHLKGLNEDVFREYFKLCLFGSDSSNNYPELELIGEKILPKLKGSPLAAKTLGRLLGRSLDPTHWDRILKSHLWEIPQEEIDILPALWLSYMYLSFHLKRCSFCALYPKDHIFKKEDLAKIWAVEGLVEPQHSGDQYFEELAHLSFFQKYGSQEKYVIHDLMREMAQLVSKDECFIVKDTNDIPRIPKNVRHLWVLKGGDVQCSDLLNLCKHKKLRTLLCDLSLKGETDNTVMEKWCTELLSMRVMVCSISEWGLPGSIGNMKLLRYLDILDSSPRNADILCQEICCLV